MQFGFIILLSERAAFYLHLTDKLARPATFSAHLPITHQLYSSVLSRADSDLDYDCPSLTPK